ncbi:hypothetical protein DFH07DRAFT_97726 [Mycena maculata]|uniref:Secreted protein n=1 Tax=Mycena maculata TaxID=230809 RepID=A0AAD7I7E3_9AGAR|nr:hypothetical protein DFH07DRAFT_97726 [Mycena maculata]
MIDCWFYVLCFFISSAGRCRTNTVIRVGACRSQEAGQRRIEGRPNRKENESKGRKSGGEPESPAAVRIVPEKCRCERFN